jgi:peptidoglycan/LPS O-acetylase OafA/YrhL
MPYVRQIDGLRFFSFLAVFLFHCQPRKLWFGAYGVHLFFTLSGFLITYLLLASEGPDRLRTVGVFYARRALRIFPAYYLAIALGLALGTLLLPWWHATYLYNLRVFYASTRVDVTSFFTRYQGTGTHFWSLCIEEQFYLLYPWLLLWVPRARRGLFLGGLIVFSMASRAVLATLQPTWMHGLLLPVCAEYLAWGALAALLLKEGRFPAIPNGLLLWGGAAATLGLCFLRRPPVTSPLELQFQPGLMQTVRALAFTALVVGLWRDRGSPLTLFLRLPPLVFLGKISYGLYLYHLFVFEPYETLVEAAPWVARIGHDLGLFLMTVALASASWFLVELPLNRLKERVPALRARPGG